MGKFIFDGPTLTIEGDPTAVVSGVLQFTATELYSEWVDWTTQGDNLKYLPAFSTAGGDSLGGGTYIGAYIFMRNDLGWRGVPPDVGDVQVVIEGNFYPSDPMTPFFIPWPGVVTVIQSRVSQMTQTISTSTPIIEQANPALIADAILDSAIGTSRPAGSLGEFFIKKVLTVAKFIGLR